MLQKQVISKYQPIVILEAVTVSKRGDVFSTITLLLQLTAEREELSGKETS